MPYRAKKNYKRFEKPKVTNLEVTEPDELINFLMKKFPDRSHNKVKSWLRNKTVELNGAVVTLYNQKLIAGDKISIHWKRIASGRDLKGITIVYEDSDIIVINKPAGMLSVATAKSNETAYSILSQHIKEQNPNNRIFIVHRLDRETSGLMMFAKSEEIQALLQEDWKTNIYDRRYIAVTAGDKPIGDGVYESYLAQNKAYVVYSTKDRENGQLAVTHYKTLKTKDRYSLMEINLETGRKNQIRVHMSDLGQPIIGDKKYGSKENLFNRIGLHAWILGFTHPRTKEKMHFESNIPNEFLKVFE